jgi:hypothetical protein
MSLTLKTLLVVSGTLAVAALVLPLAALNYDATLAYETCTRISFWLAMTCVLLFVIGMVRFRRRGLWLALPLAVAMIWMIYFFWMLAQMMEGCAKTGRCP